LTPSGLTSEKAGVDDRARVLVAFVVEVERRFKAVQGLPSPVRAGRGRSRIPAGEGISVVLRIGVTFDDGQLTERGWFFDTDAAAEVMRQCCDELGRRPWTELFDFRPTFEMVARRLYRELTEQIAQLAYVELRDETFGTTTRYSPAWTDHGGEVCRCWRGRSAGTVENRVP
jgi:hypothetical protein